MINFFLSGRSMKVVVNAQYSETNKINVDVNNVLL